MKNEYIIRPILLLKSNVPKAFMTYQMNWDKRAVLGSGVWFIEGASEKIVVDAGRASTVSSWITGEAFHHEFIQSLEEGLDQLGLKPADIDIVIMTHLHWDHVELAYKYVNATFVVQRAELDFARNPRGISAAQSFKKELFEQLNFEVVEGDSELRPGIQLLLTPGHTPGGQSVAIKTEKGLAIITGFCCIRENFEPPLEVRSVMPIITPSIHINSCELDESMLRIKEVADIILPLHDIEALQKSRIPDL